MGWETTVWILQATNKTEDLDMAKKGKPYEELNIIL